MRRAVLIALAGAGVVAGALPAAANAAWSDPQLVSVDNGRLEQADGPTTAVDVSADGRWVVFQTRATNFFADDDADAPGTMRRGGIFRFDRTTGAIALVADGDLLDDDSGDTLLRGATDPSVSDDGRFVVFATAQQLVPQDDNTNIDVYRRDMSVPLSADRAGGGAYTLVSARDGGDEPAHYAAGPEPVASGDPGASVFAGQSLSADGRFVAFRTTELASDLPALQTTDAPGGSVFVRDIQQQRTVAVSVRLDGSGSAGGALPPVVMSRDGSTVAWVGEDGPQQTPMLTGESLDMTQRYYLWRRWDDAGASTRRITGLADPDDSACPPGGGISFNPVATGPCYGPLTDAEGSFGDISGRAPALSADGWTVAYLTAAGARPAAADDGYLDVFITSMRPGLSRKAATTVVTKGTTANNARANGDVQSLSLSADARRLALVTARREFLPPAPTLVSPARTSPPTANELYVFDLGAGGRIRRPLMPGGGEIDGSVDPSFALSADGRTVIFLTRAGNLIYGDANQQPDAFAVTETDDQLTAPPPVGLGDDPVDVDLDGDAQFGARATSRRDGALVLRVTAPVAGAVRAIARTIAVKATPRRGRRAARRAVKARQVSSVRGSASRPATVRFVLSLRGRDRSRVRSGRPLPVRVTVTLTPATKGERARRVTVSGTFRVPRRTAASKSKGSKRAQKRGSTRSR
ncbi:hypothetical protein Q5424_20840 [Conexibacter sp. JD483]|uniref:hypothetical protein n=1 Tax=unclassified Conexibacter TaxID=2627773 RepID=UPI0027179B40|nr:MULTISPECIES: hypothetical protein [unclassified Conexibacter]MDO8185019.1 hypothetical protein [Conexibacter sp. CPCC 205706]MDO8198163.1 hypothetical protein [Conexibacter sp. CPCC 205762]MDR9371559.1 hypothetical protein [Conexibacter sp. JD483]